MENAEQIKLKVEQSFQDKLGKLKAKLASGEEILEDERIKVAVLADSPTVVTGFGNVCREILGHLQQTGMYDFDVVGINYDGSPHGFPIRIFPAVNAMVADQMYREPYGRQRFLDMLGEGRFDLVWVLQDSFIIGEEIGKMIALNNESLPPGLQYASMFYFPIDATPKKRWIDGSAMHFDLPVVYTQYGYDEVLKLYDVKEDTQLTPDEVKQNIREGEEIRRKLRVLYHGVNTAEFFPIEDRATIEKLRENLWHDKKDKFVFANVNRNQPRKDLYRTLLAFKKLLDSRRAKGKDDVYLYLHCNVFDNNINLLDVAKQIGLVEGAEFAFPDPKMFGPATGFPTAWLNDMYNAADAVVTTTLGEGWGLSITEAMATKRLVIAPDHTSISEMLGKTKQDGPAGGIETEAQHVMAERGILVKTSGSFVQQNDNGRIRPITDVDDLADRMEFVVENRERLQPTVERAYEWVKLLEWSGNIGKTWEAIFEDAYRLAHSNRLVQLDLKVSEQFKGLGRNDDCPVCKIKIKKCRHSAMVR